MATYSSILACEIPWTEEPGGLQSTGFSQEPDTTERLNNETHVEILSHCLERRFSPLILPPVASESAVPTLAGQAGGHAGLGPAERARRSGRPGWRGAGWPLPELGRAAAGVGWVLLQSQGRRATGNTGPTSSTLSAWGSIVAPSLAGPSTSAPKSSRRPPPLRATGPDGTRRGTREDSGLTQ